jgi:hypothetical protein
MQLSSQRPSVSQTFIVPSNASLSVSACRELIERGIFTSLRQSRILQLHAAPAELDNAAIPTRTARLRSAALRLLLTIALQLQTNRQAIREVASLVGTDGSGCLGPRARDVLSNASSPGMPL